MSYVSIPGLGAVPEYFLVGFDGFNIEKYSDGTNNHNENNFYGRCNRDDLVNDDFIISGARNPYGYTLTVCMNSEVAIPLYRDGCVTLNYDAASQKWNTMAGLVNNRIWRSCSADNVVKLIADGLKCYASEGGDYNTEIGAFASGIEESSSLLVQSTAQYPGEGCDYILPSLWERFLSGMDENGY